MANPTSLFYTFPGFMKRLMKALGDVDKTQFYADVSYGTATIVAYCQVDRKIKFIRVDLRNQTFSGYTDTRISRPSKVLTEFFKTGFFDDKAYFTLFVDPRRINHPPTFKVDPNDTHAARNPQVYCSPTTPGYDLLSKIWDNKFKKLNQSNLRYWDISVDLLPPPDDKSNVILI